MSSSKLNYTGLTVSSCLSISIIDKSQFHSFPSVSSHVPDQYLHARINCLHFEPLVYTDHKEDLDKEISKIKNSAEKADLTSKK